MIRDLRRRLQGFPLTLILLAAGQVWAVEYHDLVEKPFDKLSDRQLSDWGERALKISPEKWKHGETTHFVVHFFRRGPSVANQSETFYRKIREFFGNPSDKRTGRKSHVFAFHKPEDWEQFARLTGMGGIAGITREHEFFYIASTEGGGFDSKGHVQAHEMTHLVFNRLFEGRPPLWLNEGIAEYFGLLETANLPDVHRALAAVPRFPLEELFAAGGYPESEIERRAFYGEATVVVDFLSHSNERKKLLPKFVELMIANEDLGSALGVYGYQSQAQFQDAYEKYRRARYR